MQLDNLESSGETRLNQIIHTLEHVHGVNFSVNVDDDQYESQLLEHKKIYEQKRDDLIKESGFNTYLSNPDYTKSILILEAIKIILTEIAPKRRRKHAVKESEERASTRQPVIAGNTFADYLMDISKKIPSDDDKSMAFANALSSIANRLQNDTPATALKLMKPVEKDIIRWIKTLPTPVEIDKLIIDGIEKFGEDLMNYRKISTGKFTNIDKNINKLGQDKKVKEDKGDQDNDGDIDFADIMISRRIASGEPRKTAIAKTRHKSYNTEEMMAEGPVDNFTIDDIRHLEKITDIDDARDFAKSLISKPSRRPMKKEKVAWFNHRIDGMHYVSSIVKLMYDLLLSGEGHSVIGSKHSTEKSSYRKTFVEAAEIDSDVTDLPAMDNKIAMQPKLSVGSEPVALKQAHHYEYQASMARSELYRNAKYAMSMMKQIDPHGEIPPWIAGCLTKAANYLDKIYHYLDYYKKFEPEKLPEQIDNDMELGETSGGVARQNLLQITEYSTKLFDIIEPGDKLEGWVAMKLTTASECISSSKHYMDYVQFENHGLDDHFAEARRTKKPIKEEQMLAEQEDLAKASTILAAKDMSSKIQSIAEDVAKMSVEDLMPLVDIMRQQFGPEATTAFNDIVKEQLDQLLDLATKTKETMDTAIDTLNKGGVPSASSDIETAGEEPTGEEPAGETAPTDIDSEIEQLTSPEGGETPEPLGRGKKEELAEKWNGKKMHTAKKDIGKWEGYSLAELKAKKSKLMKKEKRTAAEQKTVKQLNFAIRAKTGWGKVSEDDTMEGNEFSGALAKAKAAGEKTFKVDGKTYNVTEAKSKHGVCNECGTKFESAKNYKHCKDHKGARAIVEKAPPGKKAEAFIKSNKAEFKKRHGAKKGEKILYATAWKKFGPKNENYDAAENILKGCKIQLESLRKDFKNHKKIFSKQLNEGVVQDPLYIGYGLEGTVILNKIAEIEKIMERTIAQKKKYMQEGVIGMIQNIESLNKARKIQKAKNETPYGVIYTTDSGKQNLKLFETADQRKYWLDFKGLKLDEVKLINPDTFENAIKRALKG